MNNNNGWIKLYRKIIEWEWHKDPNTFSLFVHLILMANHKEQSWRGIIIKRGEILTGRKKLSEITGISEQSIRTSLKRLKLTNEITIKSTSHYSIISVVNYNLYQADNQQSNQQLTNNQPTTNQQLTTNNNNKNIKNDNNDKNIKKENTIKENFLEELNQVTHTKISQKDLKELLKTYSKDQLLTAGSNWHNIYFEGKSIRNEKERAFQFGKNKTRFIQHIDLWIDTEQVIKKVEDERDKKKMGDNFNSVPVIDVNRNIASEEELEAEEAYFNERN